MHKKTSYRTGIAETSKVMNLMGDCLATDLSIKPIPSTQKSRQTRSNSGGAYCPNRNWLQMFELLSFYEQPWIRYIRLTTM